MGQSRDYTISSLCDHFNISRTTGHKLVKRFSQDGEDSLNSNSKRPHNSPQKTPKKVEDMIIKLRKKYPNWGARKLKVLLRKRNLEKNIPSETTINAILKRNGLIVSRRRRNPKEGK